MEDKQIKETITAQLKIKKIIENNSNIVKKISEEKFPKKYFDKFAMDNNLVIKKITLNNIKNEKIFTSNIIKEIFKIKNNELRLITDSKLSKNYIIFAEKTEKSLFDKNIKDYAQYKSKAKLTLGNQIYITYDKTINSKYDIEINQKVLSRIKNTL